MFTNTKRPFNRRRAMSLTELIIASTLLTTTVTSVAMVMRTGRDAWKAQDDDHAQLEAAHAVVRHVVRRVRQADSVLAISGSSDTSGDLSLLMETG